MCSRPKLISGGSCLRARTRIFWLWILGRMWRMWGYWMEFLKGDGKGGDVDESAEGRGGYVLRGDQDEWVNMGCVWCLFSGCCWVSSGVWSVSSLPSFSIPPPSSSSWPILAFSVDAILRFLSYFPPPTSRLHCLGRTSPSLYFVLCTGVTIPLCYFSHL